MFVCSHACHLFLFVCAHVNVCLVCLCVCAFVDWFPGVLGIHPLKKSFCAATDRDQTNASGEYFCPSDYSSEMDASLSFQSAVEDSQVAFVS